MCRSEPHTPARVSLTRIAPGSTSGTGYSLSSNSPPYARSTATRPFIRPSRFVARGSVGQTLGAGDCGSAAEGAAVPHAGQCVHAASSAALHEAQTRVGAGLAATVAGALVSSSSVATPFLNSFIDLPRDFASSGSLAPPNRTSAITRMTINSYAPRP